MSARLHTAILTGDIEAVRKILKTATAEDVNRQDKDRCAALAHAIVGGHTEIAKMLLTHPGIEVNLQIKDGYTAFLLATELGHTEIVKMMMAHPYIDVNRLNENGYTALMWACCKGKTEVVKVLLAHPSIMVNKQMEDGKTALYWASLWGQTKIVEVLLTYPTIDVNLQDRFGDTTLMHASLLARTEIVKMLLAHPGMDVNAKNMCGQSASDIAANAEIKALFKVHAASTVTVPRIKQPPTPVTAPSAKQPPPPVTTPRIKQTPTPPIAIVATSAISAPDNTTSASWLESRLLASGVNGQQVRDCEQKLALEGIVSEGDFSECIPDMVNHAYLTRIGITAMGLQNKIIKLHRELHAQCIKNTPLPLHPPSPPPSTVNSDAVLRTFSFGDLPILDVHPMTTDLTSLHGYTSSRLLLCGHFCHTTTDLHGDRITKYNCVIKCAGDTATCAAKSEGAKAIQRERAMYEHVKEIARLKGTTSTGCIACYYMHPSSNYLVLESHGQDISGLLVSSFKFAPQLAESIIIAVATLHSLGTMHGDIKPHNFLYTFSHERGYVVKLCDLDCANKVGEVCAATALGTKQYESPEVYFASRANENVTAALSMDMFSLGLVLWQVLTRSPYPPLHSEQLNECYSNQDKLIAQLVLTEQCTIYAPLLHSITKLNPSDRISADALYKGVRDIAASKAQQNYHKEKQDHMFLKEVVSDKLDVLDRKLQLLRLDQERLGVQVGLVLREHKRLDTMMRTLIAGTHSIPTYAIILPVVAKTWLKKADPMRLVRNKYRLYFLCSHTHQIAPCGPKGEGYKITVTKQWVRDAAPVLMAALIVLKLALMAGGLPLPIPDLSPLLDTPALHVKYLDAAMLQVKMSCDQRGSAGAALDKTIDSLDSVGVEDVFRLQREEGMTLEEGSLKAYATIQSILRTDNIDIALSSGLRQVVHPMSGKTAWVLDNDAVAQQYCDSVSATVPNSKTTHSSASFSPQPREPAESIENRSTSTQCACIIF